MRRRVVIAPDSFKGTLSARDAALAVAQGWQSERPDDELLLVPQADGGEGTLDAIAQATPSAQWRSALVAGPTGEPHDARWLMLPGDHAVVELAECCGITLLPLDADGRTALAPLTASSRGVGDAIAAALDSGARRVTLALGGSASTDAGFGALSALGLRALDDNGDEIEPGGAALERLTTIDVMALRSPPPDGITVLTDTTAVLCGPNGAAVVFGPQKGASPELISQLNQALAQAAAVSGTHQPSPDRPWLAAIDRGSYLQPGAGAAGGTAWAFLRFWGASIQSGAETIGALTGLDAALEGADLVITGEGRFDATSLAGKVVGAIVDRASVAVVPVAVVAGQADLSIDESGGVDVEAAGLEHVLTLTDLAGSSEAAVAEPERWLRAAGAELARRATRR